MYHICIYVYHICIVYVYVYTHVCVWCIYHIYTHTHTYSQNPWNEEEIKYWPQHEWHRGCWSAGEVAKDTLLPCPPWLVGKQGSRDKICILNGESPWVKTWCSAGKWDSGQSDTGVRALRAGGDWSRWNLQCCSEIGYTLYPTKKKRERWERTPKRVLNKWYASSEKHHLKITFRACLSLLFLRSQGRDWTTPGAD